jgi:peptidoglycan LD-endopeptidase CwlK
VPSRSLDDLTLPTRERALRMLAQCKLEGIDLLIYCTWRSAAEQADLWAVGRTKPGKPVTWAKPGQSLHERGAAFDCVPLVGGKAVWQPDGPAAELWGRVGVIGEACGLEWAGRWPARIREFPHFQFSGDGP